MNGWGRRRAATQAKKDGRREGEKTKGEGEEEELRGNGSGAKTPPSLLPSLVRLVYRPPRYCRSRSRHRHLCHRRGWSDRQADRQTMRGVHACWERERKERDTERREGLKSGTSGTAQKTKICSASLRSHCQTACQSVRLLVAGMMLYCGLLKGLQGMSTMSGKVKWPREFLQLALPGTARAGEVHYVCDMCRGRSTDLHSKCRQVASMTQVRSHIVRLSLSH